MMLHDTAAENILERLSDLENYPEGTLAPYEEFLVGGKTYYFTPRWLPLPQRRAWLRRSGGYLLWLPY
jgi:hypothetical protein